MPTSSVLSTLLAFTYLIYTQRLGLLLTLQIITIIMYFFQHCVINNYSFTQIKYYLQHGENVYSLLTATYLYYSNNNVYLYYVPLALATMVKIYLVRTKKEAVDMNFVDETAIFQPKTQLFLIFYTILLNLYQIRFIQTLVLILILKLKYSMHDKTRLSFKQLHFAIDNALKRTKIRNIYQKFVYILNLAGNTYGGSKQICY